MCDGSVLLVVDVHALAWLLTYTHLLGVVELDQSGHLRLVADITAHQADAA